MAVKKKAKKKTSKKKTGTGKAMAKIDEQLAQYASQESARETVAGTNKLSIKGGKFSFQGANLGKEVEVIVVAWSFEKTWYDTPFDQDNPSTPACFAIDTDGKEMVPHADAPNKQAQTCDECELNQWGSSPTGSRGKACSDRRRLIVISADEEDFAEAEFVQLSVGPTTLKNWKGYVNDLNNKLQLPTFGVVTNISFDEDSDFEVLEFNVSEKIADKKVLSTLLGRLEEATKLACQPYDSSGYAGNEGSGKGKKKAGKKKASKKKVGKKKKRGSKFSR